MQGSGRADLVSAWAVGIGVGLIALQITWLVANRITSLYWEPPAGPTIAFATALAVGGVISVIAGQRLAKKATDRSPPNPRQPT
jgi:divalent metal cation (Fe/Co/Zn/Cd) transporter